MTERQLLAAIFIALAEIAKQITGKKLTIPLVDGDGEATSICGASHCVTWTDGDQEERVSPATIQSSAERAA